MKKIWGSLLFYILIFGFEYATAQNINFKEMLEENRVVLISDFDLILTGRAWNTLWVLQKIPTPNSFMQNRTRTADGYAKFDELPDEVSITEWEFWNKYINSLAVKERNGSFSVRGREATWLSPIPGFQARSAPVLLIPGFYYINAQSFRNFRPNRNGPSFLLQDNAIARETEKATGLSRFGMAFPVFQKLSRTVEGLENIHVSTARGQAAAEWQSLFDEWRDEGFIKYSHGKDRNKEYSINVQGMSEAEAILYGRHITEKKLRYLDESLLTHYRLLAKQRGKKYLIIIPEDNIEIVHEYHKRLLELSGVANYNDYLEFLLVHGGTDEQVRDSDLPGRYTMYENGFAVEAPASLVRAISGPSHPQTIAEIEAAELAKGVFSCRQLFLKGI